MSKPVKNLLTEAYRKRFEDLTGAVIIDIRGVEANDNNRLRTGLAEKQIKATVVKNSLAKKAFEGTGLASLNDIIDGPSTMVYSVDGETSVVSLVRELIDWAKQIDNLDFRGALMDGQVFGADQITTLSKLPTREEALAQVVQLILTPAQNVVSVITSPASQVASIVQAVGDKLEKGEKIAAA